MLDLLRVAEQQVLGLVRQHEPPEGLVGLVKADAPVDLHGVALGHLAGPVEDVAGGLEAVGVALGEDAGPGDAALAGAHAAVGVADRAQPAAVLEDAVGVVPPLAGLRVEDVLGQQLPALGRHHLQGLEDEADLGLGHEVGEREPREARPQGLRVRLVTLAVALVAVDSTVSR